MTRGTISRKKSTPNIDLHRETDEEGRVTRSEYDKQNRLVAVKNVVDGREVATRYEYDAAGNRTAVIDALGRFTETRYDEWSRPHRIIDPDNYTITIEHDGEGN